MLDILPLTDLSLFVAGSDCVECWSVLRNLSQSSSLTVDSGELSAARQIYGGTSVPETQLFPDSPGGKTGHVIRQEPPPPPPLDVSQP